MSANLDGITSTAITWEKDASDIKEDSKGKSTISVTGSVGDEDDDISLAQAIDLIPSTLPLGDSGPIGDSQKYAGAKRVERGARYNGDGTIEVTATYEIATPENQINYGDTSGGGDTSDSDRIARTSATEDAPILTHPVVQEFPKTQARLLASVLNGDIRVNPRYNEEGSGRELWEFIRDNEDGDDIEQVDFDDSDYTSNEVTASPLDYARAVAAGVEVWRRPVIRHSVISARNSAASDNEFKKVGRAVPSSSIPADAPSIGGQRQWFVTSLSDSTENGESWTLNYEYELSGDGGVLKILYPNGNAEIQ